MLVARAGQIVPKDELLQAGWKDLAVGDNSLEQVISTLRKLLGPGHIETLTRRGYRFVADVERRASRESDAVLDSLLEPHRAFLEGRAALETFEAGKVAQARAVFERALASAPEHASSHIGLANACVMQFEMTRVDASPNTSVLAIAVVHAREACRLDPQSGEAWATLGFVLDRTSDRVDAVPAAKCAVTLEPDNWRHHFRLSSVSWGEERRRAAQRTLALLPDFPLAHWLAATVHVARQAWAEADRELAAPLARDDRRARFGSVALHWLQGLLLLDRGDDVGALQAFQRELASEHGGHLYARECSANTWYAIGALRLRQGLAGDARAAFQHALNRVPQHPMARIGFAVANGAPPALPTLRTPKPGDGRSACSVSVETALVHAGHLVTAGAHADAAHVVHEALLHAPDSGAGWHLAVEPLLHVSAHAGVWARALARLRDRAS